jgi:gas vesicle protein
MLKLSQNKVFKQEYEHFQNKINMITDDKIKNELQDLLSRLAYNVKKIDDQHNEFTISNKLPTFMSDIRSEINDVRRKLMTRISDYEQSLQNRLG